MRDLLGVEITDDPPARRRAERRPTGKQKEILAIASLTGEITLDDVVDRFGRYYYHNGRKHLGAMLSRMVDSGWLVRVGQGRFKLP